LFPRSRFTDRHATAVVFLQIHGLDRRLGLGVAFHFHKTKPLAAACKTVRNDLRAGDDAALRKQTFEVRAGDVVA
jgi:hypothetical protein